MEVAGSDKRAHIVFLYELIGTALFVYSILLTNNAISIAFSLFASIIIFGSITGGHFNPAVTLGVYIKEAQWAKNAKWLAIVICAQLCGAMFAQLLAQATLFENEFSNIPEKSVPKLCP